MALRRKHPKAAVPAKGRRAAAVPAPDADREKQIFEELRERLYFEPKEVLLAFLGAKFRLTEEEGTRKIATVRRAMRRFAVEALRTSHEDLFLRALEDGGRARREKRYDDARQADRLIMQLTGAAAPKKHVVGFGGVGIGAGGLQLEPKVAGLLGIMSADEVESIIAEGEEVVDDDRA